MLARFEWVFPVPRLCLDGDDGPGDAVELFRVQAAAGGRPPVSSAGTCGRCPKYADVVAYCRGPYCALADDAVRLLRRHGYRARPMDGGLPEWRDEGMPIAAA